MYVAIVAVKAKLWGLATARPTPASSAGKKFNLHSLINNTSSPLSFLLHNTTNKSLATTFMFVRRAILSRGYRSLVRSTSRPSFVSSPITPVARTASPFSSLSSRSFAVANPAMADSASTSGVTADGLKEKLSVQLETQFVEIEDMSGTPYFSMSATSAEVISNLFN